MPRDLRVLPDTLADLVRSGQDLIVHCESCWHRASVDLLAQIEAQGEAYRLQSFIDQATCSKCGAHRPKLHVTVMPVRPSSSSKREA
jgi:hypothetical protein